MRGETQRHYKALCVWVNLFIFRGKWGYMDVPRNTQSMVSKVVMVCAQYSMMSPYSCGLSNNRLEYSECLFANG